MCIKRGKCLDAGQSGNILLHQYQAHPSTNFKGNYNPLSLTALINTQNLFNKIIWSSSQLRITSSVPHTLLEVRELSTSFSFLFKAHAHTSASHLLLCNCKAPAAISLIVFLKGEFCHKSTQVISLLQGHDEWEDHDAFSHFSEATLSMHKTWKPNAIELHSPSVVLCPGHSFLLTDRYNTEIDVLGLQRVGTGALQEAEVWIEGLHNLINLAHCVHRLHPAGNHHWAS